MSLPSCDSDRPGAETHRTLYVPQAFVDAATSDEVASWATKLCCTFNWMEITSDTEAYLVTYARNERRYSQATTFVEAAQAAHALRKALPRRSTTRRLSGRPRSSSWRAGAASVGSLWRVCLRAPRSNRRTSRHLQTSLPPPRSLLLMRKAARRGASTCTSSCSQSARRS